MKIKSARFIPLTFLPLTLLLGGCWTNPASLEPVTGNPSFAGGMTFVVSTEVKAIVESVEPAQRELVLKYSDGTVATNIVGPEVVNLNEIKVGDEVKAALGTETAVFLIKNGPPPSARQEIMVQVAGKGRKPAGVMVHTHDLGGQVVKADRSYRILTLKFASGRFKTYKVPLPYTLEHVEVGDVVVVRSTDSIALRVTPEKH